MTFANLFPHQTIIATLGDDVTYTAAGVSPVAIKAIVNSGTRQTFAGDAYVPESQVIIDTLKTGTPAIKKGDTFIHKGKTHTVDAIVNDDGYIVSVAVH